MLVALSLLVQLLNPSEARRTARICQSSKQAALDQLCLVYYCDESLHATYPTRNFRTDALRNKGGSNARCNCADALNSLSFSVGDW